MSMCLSSLNLKCPWIFVVVAVDSDKSKIWKKMVVGIDFYRFVVISKRIKTNIINVTFATYVISHNNAANFKRNTEPLHLQCSSFSFKLYLLQVKLKLWNTCLTRTHKSARQICFVWSQPEAPSLSVRTSHSYSSLALTHTHTRLTVCRIRFLSLSLACHSSLLRKWQTVGAE